MLISYSIQKTDAMRERERKTWIERLQRAKETKKARNFNAPHFVKKTYLVIVGHAVHIVDANEVSVRGG